MGVDNKTEMNPKDIFIIPPTSLLMAAQKEHLKAQLEYYKMKEKRIKEKIKEIKKELKNY